MENKGLLFIPDISGFTQFVNETDIDHSRLIIQELLELLINSNQIGLEVSEIEGDAILFYKFGEPPDLQVIYNQVAQMFRSFHSSLLAYDQRRYCQCRACIAAINLSLKVITHYGEFTGYNVKNFKKLIGKDVIIAHQLLKNDIDQHEYWLVTKDLVRNNTPSGFTNWMKWNASSKQTEIGEVVFHYAQLSQLKNEIASEPPPKLDLSKKVKLVSASREYATDIITLFHAVGDFSFRSRWQEGVIKVEGVSQLLPRVGMRCRCLMQNGEITRHSSSYSYSPDKIEFSETDEKERGLTYFSLEKNSGDGVRLTIDYYGGKNIFRQMAFRLTRRKKMKNALERSLRNLEQVVKEIHLPVVSMQDTMTPET